jgi:hypothetical protein
MLFCRALGIYTDAPIDTKTMTFLSKARSRFAQVQARYMKKQKPSKAVMHLGGEAPLIEIYELVVRLFEKDRAAGESIIGRLQPDLFREAG